MPCPRGMISTCTDAGYKDCWKDTLGTCPRNFTYPTVGMFDWGAFTPNPGAKDGAVGVDRLVGNAGRGISMARTLGSGANQVAEQGRRVWLGWLSDDAAGASAQSLARDLSLAEGPDAGTVELLQAFVPELRALRTGPAPTGGAQVEVVATFSLPTSAPEHNFNWTFCAKGTAMNCSVPCPTGTKNECTAKGFDDCWNDPNGVCPRNFCEKDNALVCSEPCHFYTSECTAKGLDDCWKDTTGVCAATPPPFGIKVLASADGSEGTTFMFDLKNGLLLGDATTQGNAKVRAGPIVTPETRKTHTLHAIVDHSLIEVIADNRTALTLIAKASDAANIAVELVGTGSGAADVKGTLEVYGLASP